ncbi:MULTISPECIES: hypothetical protein [Vibrio]|uniref:hypothetical protein n=1 Tax=Vibrio TaxID=662 RepID=UPI000C83ED03|nr:MULTISPECIES: hypothetical protein [Vibrio]PMJ63847.1 hypothetical protein BCU18_17780 [Vibrio lentus]
MTSNRAFDVASVRADFQSSLDLELFTTFDLHGDGLSRLKDDKWISHQKVLDEVRVTRTLVANIPFLIRHLIIRTYRSDDAEKRMVKEVSFLNAVIRVRAIIGCMPPDIEPKDMFTRSALMKYLEHVNGKYAYSSLSELLSTFNVMAFSAHREGLCELPKFNMTALTEKYCSSGRLEKKQTLAIPLGIATTILGNALELYKAGKDSLDEIEMLAQQYGSHFDKAKSRREEAIREKGEANVTVGVNYYMKPRGQVITESCLLNSALSPYIDGDYNPINVCGWLNRVLNASYQLLLAFTGMRIHELARLHDGSFQTYTEGEDVYHTLTAETSKLSDSEDIVDEWVCSEMCDGIIKFIGKIKAIMNLNTRSLYVTFSSIRKLSVKTVYSIKERHVENLVKGVCLSEADYKEFCTLNRDRQNDAYVGMEWNLTPHQWRRSFAVLALRFDLATLPAIKRQFKHISLQMTEWYANYARITRNEELRVDTKLNTLVNEIQNDMSADVLFDAYNTDKVLMGGFSAKISKLKESGKVPEIYSTRSSIKALIERGDIQLNYSGLTYCTNGYRCDQDGSVNAAFCASECDHTLIPEELKDKWIKLHERCTSHLEFASDCGSISPVSYSHFMSQIKAAEHVMRAFGVEFEEYKG